MINFKGVEFDTVEYEGIVFATMDLADVLIDDNGLFVNDEARKIDNTIAYYFEPAEFYNKTNVQLYNLYNEIRSHKSI